MQHSSPFNITITTNTTNRNFGTVIKLNNINMKKFFLASVAMTMLIGTMSCNSAKKQDAETENSSQVQNDENSKKQVNENIFGTYEGTIPCADCAGKKMKLSVLNDGTYSLQYENLKEGEGVIDENGTYNILNDSIVETVTPSSGRKSYYVYTQGNLVLSDSLGTINKGELADLYVLKKQK